MRNRLIINRTLILIFVIGFLVFPILKPAHGNSVFSESHIQNYKNTLTPAKPKPYVAPKHKMNPHIEVQAPAKVKPKSQVATKPAVKTEPKLTLKESTPAVSSESTQDVSATAQLVSDKNELQDAINDADYTENNIEKLELSLEEFVNESDTDREDFPIRNLQNYNIYSVLPKIAQSLVLVAPNLAQIDYGPFRIQKDIYAWPYPAAENLTQRIISAKSTLDKLESDLKSADSTNNKPQDKNKAAITDLKIHLADLYAMKHAKTRIDSYLKNASDAYQDVLDDVSENNLEAVSLNLANTLIRSADYTSAFPVIRHLAKSDSSENADAIRNTIFEFYYLSGRTQKADDIVNILIDEDELKNQNEDFRIRVGDIMFHLNHFQDAAEWYQSVLKADKTDTRASKLSWLYLAEALHQLGNEDVSQKIYQAMKPVFDDTLYERVIDFRIADTIAAKETAIKATSDIKLAEWLKIDFLSEQFYSNPKLFSSDQFIPLLSSLHLDNSTKEQIELLYGYSLYFENRFYDAINKFHTLAIKNKNRFVKHALNQMVIKSVMKQGLATKTSDEASEFIRFMMGLKYNLKSYSPDKIYQVIYHNLDLIGLENASAELTLKIIDQSVHDKKSKLYIQFKLAENMTDAFAHRQSIKILSQIDTKLLDPKTREKFNVLMISNLLETNQSVLALDVLDTWSKEGTTPRQAFWIAAKKMEILYEFKRYEEALDIANNTIGSTPIEKLPADLHSMVTPIVAYKVILANRLGKNNECLVSFYQNQNKILETGLKDDILISAVSSALTMHKANDVKQIMQIARTKLDQQTYEWMEKWTNGEMWINQVNKYLDNSNIAINEERR